MKSSRHNAPRSRRFTLIELLCVVAIICILIGITLPALHKAKNSVRKIVCMNNMKQIGVALTLYHTDNDRHMPPWLSSLFPDYFQNDEILHCPCDGNPDDTPVEEWKCHQHGEDFTNAFDRKGNSGVYGQDPNWEMASRISYFYEFNQAPPPVIWGWTEPTWDEQKTKDMRLNYSNRLSTFPIVRCTWHYKQPLDRPYFNLSYMGTFFYSLPKWEDGVW